MLVLTWLSVHPSVSPFVRRSVCGTVFGHYVSRFRGYHHQIWTKYVSRAPSHKYRKRHWLTLTFKVIWGPKGSKLAQNGFLIFSHLFLELASPNFDKMYFLGSYKHIFKLTLIDLQGHCIKMFRLSQKHFLTFWVVLGASITNFGRNVYLGTFQSPIQSKVVWRWPSRSFDENTVKTSFFHIFDFFIFFTHTYYL